jgi:hypothetical protein
MPLELDDRLAAIGFVPALEDIYPSLLKDDPIMRLAAWNHDPERMMSVLHHALRVNETVGELIGQFGGDDMRYLYVILHVLRVLSQSAALPVEHIDQDVSLQRGECQVAFGDVIVHGSVKHHQGCLIALGNVTIEGVCADDAFAYSCLLVGGSLTTRGMATFGNVAICGDLEAREIVYGCYNDYSLYVGGTLRTKYIVRQYHNIQSEALDVQGILDEYEQMDQLRDLLVPSLVQPSEQSSRRAYEFYPGDMIELLAQGQPIYR